MTAKRNYYGPAWAVGGPGESGAAPAAEAASRMASAASPTPDSVGNEAQEPVTAPLPGEKQEPVAAPLPGRGRGPEAAPVPEEGRGPEGAPSLAGDQPGSDGAGQDGEPELEFDLEALVAKAEQADAYLELAQRTKADFENYRKRAAREAAAAQDRGVAKLALALLPAVDNLDRAVAAADSAAPVAGPGQVPPARAVDGVATLVSGIKLVHADVIAALARVGIEPFSPEGEPFDPQHHEAVAQQLVEGAQPGTVAEVYQRGYRLGDSVLRPARVLVAA
jgi:molecular chaperone GrpE